MRRVFYGWWVVLAASIGLFASFGPIVSFTFGVFIAPLSREFSWTRGEISGAFSLAMLMLGLCSPAVGRLVDRIGARRVILPATLLFGMSLMGLSLVRALWQFYFVYLLMGLVGGGTAPVPYSTVVSRWFDRRRGLALGLMMVGTGLGMFFMPSFAHALIERWGWRRAYIVLGAMVVLMTIPIVGALLKDSPQAMGLSPDGAPPRPMSPEQEERRNEGVDLAHTLRMPTFWTLVATFFLVSATVHGCLTHLAPMLTDRGVSPQGAARATSLLGGAVLIGRVVTGYLLDRFFAPRVAVGFFTGATVGVLLLWGGATHDLAFVSAFLVGLGMGAEVDIIAYLVSRYFGLRAFGSIYGYAFAAYIFGGLAGPLAMGIGVDRTGAYHWPLGVFSIAMLIAIGLLLRLGPYPRGADASQVESATGQLWDRREVPSADSSLR
jgi:sugar phosphate permease